MFYGSFGSAGGLYELGTAVSGAEQIKDMADTIQIGANTNEELVGEALEPYRKEVVIATKFGSTSEMKNPLVLTAVPKQ